MNDSDDSEEHDARPRPSWKVLLVMLMILLVLGGQMVFGIHLLWRKWHERPVHDRPPGTVEKIDAP